MFTAKILALELGALLVYAGVKGLSVRRLFLGDNTTAAANPSIGSGSSSTAPATSGAMVR